MYSYHAPLIDSLKRDYKSCLLAGEKVSTPDYGTYPVSTVDVTPLKSVDLANIDLEEQEDDGDQRIKDSGHTSILLGCLSSVLAISYFVFLFADALFVSS